MNSPPRRGSRTPRRNQDAPSANSRSRQRNAGIKTALDIDYRPNLWGVAGHGEGESRFVESSKVTAKLQSSLHLFDLIVGTEEEFYIAGGSTDTATVQFFFARGVVRKDLRNDGELDQVHWATNRHGDWSQMRVFAFDHRAQLEEMESASPDRIGAFKQLCLEATLKVQDRRHGYGILCDGRLGADALSAAEGQGLWIGRPVERPGSRPLTLESALGLDYGGLSEWPRDQVVKVLCFCHPDDDGDMWSAQEAVVQRLFHAARRNRLEFLLEVIPSKVGPVQDDTTARIIQRFYDLDVYPDWWKLEPVRTEAAWRNSVEAIERSDPRTRGIIVLGLDAPEGELATSFALAAKFPLVKGFAVGRTIFGDVARAWMRGESKDADAIAELARRFTRLCGIWDKARANAREDVV